MKLHAFFKFICSIFILVIVISCTEDKEEPKIDCAISGLKATTSDISIVTCLSGGKVTLNATGGQSPYTYSVDEVTFVKKAAFTNLSAKIYTGTIRDANNCEATIEFTIDSDVSIVKLDNVEVNANAGCGTSLGEIKITSSAGTGVHSYFLDGIAKTNTISGLKSGNHTLVIKDEAGCQITESIYVPSGVSYSSKVDGQSESIKEIITNKCTIKGCHAAGETARPDFSVFANIKSKAGQIKSRTQSGDMPREGSLTQVQIDLIACWVDDGALDN